MQTYIPEVRAVTELPVIAAGGITDGCDIVKMFKLGADGVQIATRFVLTNECAAAPEYKKVYQNAKKEDIVIISSPVGMPGRAIKTKFVEKIPGQEGSASRSAAITALKSVRLNTASSRR